MNSYQKSFNVKTTFSTCPVQYGQLDVDTNTHLSHDTIYLNNLNFILRRLYLTYFAIIIIMNPMIIVV